MLSDIQEATVMRRNLTDMLLAVKLKANLPSLFKALDYLPAPIGKRFTPPGARNMMELREVVARVRSLHVHD